MTTATPLEAGASRRLAAALERVSSNTLDECPVCLEIPAPTDARILRCCAAIMCRHCIPACNNKTCPFCRAPFQEGLVEEAQVEEGESPFTYTTLDYAAHTDYVTSVDYTVTRRYEAHDYQASAARAKDYQAKAYQATDYSAASSSSSYSDIADKYKAKDYSAASYTAKDYSAKDYSAKSYSSTTDYSSIANKYSST